MTTSDILKLNGKKINTTDLLFGDFSNINKVFSKYGLNIHDKKYNITLENKKKYTKKQLTKEQVNFINLFFEEDIKKYNELLKIYNNI